MKQLLILSGKGGTGKTTVASAFIRLSGARVYADCDVDAPNLHLIMRWDSVPKKTDYYGLPKAEINAVLCTRCGKCKENCKFEAILEDRVYKVDAFSCEGCGVCAAVCPAGAVGFAPSISGELMLYAENDRVFSTAQLKMGSGASGKLVAEVKKQMKRTSANADFVIIDGSPGIGCPVIASLSGVDMALIVAEPSLSGISDMERILKTARGFQTRAVVCINKYDVNLDNARKIEEYCIIEKIPYVGRIPFDPEAVKAINNGKTIVDIDCAAGLAVKSVYKNTMKLLYAAEGTGVI